MSPLDCCLYVPAQFQRQDPLAYLLGAQGAAFASRCWWCTAKMFLAMNGGLSEPPHTMMTEVAASMSGEHRHAKSIGARNLHCLAAPACRPPRHPYRPRSDMLRPLVHLTTRHVLINHLFATFIDQLNARDDFNQVEHGALVVPAARAKFLA